MYSLQQQVYALSLISNADSSQAKGQTVAQLEADLTASIENLYSGFGQYIGTWKTAWGPVVYQKKHLLEPEVADNSMFVAQGTDAAGNPVYVVAIAGTNPQSIFDELVEDFDTTLAAWPYGVPASPSLSPNVSRGTLDGVAILAAMQDPATGDSLATFLKGVQSTSATLIFTGHSLGGALSPAMALALFGDPGSTGAGGGLDSAGWGAVYVFPTAGPTVGDQDYATFYAHAFPQATDAQGNTWNLLTWNSLDVVPHAWSLLSQLNTLYPQLTWSHCLGHIQTALEKKGGSAYVQLQETQLQGAFAAPTVALNPVSAFLAEAVYQHTTAYFDLLNVPELASFMKVANWLQNPPPALTRLCRDLVLRYCDIHFDGAHQCGNAAADLADVTIAPPADLRA
jgi:hypothetical protein